MRELSEFLTEQEIYILEHHPAMSYKAVAEYLNISEKRVSRMNAEIKRKIQLEKKREQAELLGETPVTLTLKRKDLCVLERSLSEYICTMLSYPQKDRESEPDYPIALRLETEIRDILKQTKK